MTLYLASSNPNKFREIEKIMNEFNITISFHKAELPELQDDSLEIIALFSAKLAFKQLRQPLFTEDTGLFIESLNGFPGPYASFIFKTIGNQGILRLLQEQSNRNVVFRTAVALIISETEYISFLGETRGKISFKERGEKGWGYDPIFIPLEGDGRTYGEMSVLEKNQLSHRRKALVLLASYIKKLKSNI